MVLGARGWLVGWEACAVFEGDGSAGSLAHFMWFVRDAHAGCHYRVR